MTDEQAIQQRIDAAVKAERERIGQLLADQMAYWQTDDEWRELAGMWQVLVRLVETGKRHDAR
jgi:hypothetical protein